MDNRQTRDAVPQVAAGDLDSDAVTPVRVGDEDDTLNAIRVGLLSIEQGKGIALNEADRLLREKHKIPVR